MRVVNVVDLLSLMPNSDHPHGLDNETFAGLFNENTPVIFAFHGYPRLIHELIYHRPNPERFHVHGYIEEGTTTTPFDMLVMNHTSRFHLAINALNRVGRLRTKGGEVIDRFRRKLKEHEAYIRENGIDMPEILDWRWTAAQKPAMAV